MKKIGFFALIMSVLLLGCDKNSGPCNENFTDSRDGEVYETVLIGDQCWMAENLRYNAQGSHINPSYPSNKYGRLYDWATLMNGESPNNSDPSGIQGICPNGWHIPSDWEWTKLELSLGMDESLAQSTGSRGNHDLAMKSINGWNSNGGGTNSSGFNILPAGAFENNNFFDLSLSANFWTTHEYSSTSAYSRVIYGHTPISRHGNNKNYSFSCRCIRD